MQMNRWLTDVEPENGEASDEASYHPIRPRASVWIDPVVQQNISASSLVKERHSIPNPQTPIPARASRPVKVRPRYPRSHAISQESDITRIPTLPQPTMWQYELPDYEAESSLSSLSLAFPEAAIERAIDELDTTPPRSIDELDTVPPKQSTPTVQKSPATIERRNPKGRSFSFPFGQSPKPQRQKSLKLSDPYALSEVATVPPGAATVAVPRVPVKNEVRGLSTRVRPSAVVESTSSKLMEETASWTTGQGKNSLLAKRIASRVNDRKGQRKSSLSLNPFDRVRWWLLYPGRIEFLLWLSGTIVLVGVTCLLLFATLLSTGWMNAGLSSIAVGGGVAQTASTPGNTGGATGKSSCKTGDITSPQCHPTTVVSSGLQLTHVDNSMLFSDSPIYLYGQGFSANNTVTFTYDAPQFLCRPSLTHTDAHGAFFVSLMLGVGVSAGQHTIIAFDTASKRSIQVAVTVLPPPIGKGVRPTPTSPPPGVTPTATIGVGGGGFPTPVGQTPVPLTPTVGVTPTVVPTQAPTATVGVTPTVVPTQAPTATVGVTPTVAPTKTPPAKHTISASLLKNALYDENIDGHITVSTWFWVAIIGYILSMTMLGVAGWLYRRNRLSSR